MVAGLAALVSAYVMTSTSAGGVWEPSIELVRPAQSRSVYSLAPDVDALVISTLGTVVLVPYAFPSSFITARCPCDPAEVNAFDRATIGNHSATANYVSEALIAGVLAGPVLLDAFDAGDPEAFAEDMVVYAEAMAVTGALTTISKYVTQRPLPIVYSGDDDGLSDGPGGYRAFFAGHAALTATSLAVAAHTWTRRHGASVWPWLIAAGGTVLVSYLRVEAGRHFPSDVIVGSAVGFAVGFTIPLLH